MHLAAAVVLAIAAPAPVAAQDARAIVRHAYAAMGGDQWASARTLRLEGRAVFYGKGAAPRSTATDYRMWRVFDPARAEAHDAEGKVRIDARRADGSVLFTVGFDGATSWNEKGVIPKPQADAFWASNFGYGILRHALKPGFTLVRLPDDSVRGHTVHVVRVTDPAGQPTLFGIDASTGAVRRVGFVTPRGYHERIYDDFETLVEPEGWLQPRWVTLLYNGVIANEVFWTKAVVNAPVPDVLFAPPAPGP